MRRKPRDHQRCNLGGSKKATFLKTASVGHSGKKNKEVPRKHYKDKYSSPAGVSWNINPARGEEFKMYSAFLQHC